MDTDIAKNFIDKGQKFGADYKYSSYLADLRASTEAEKEEYQKYKNDGKECETHL